MKIKLKDIGDDGLDVSGELSQEFMGLTQEDYVYFIDPLSVSAHLDRVDDMIIAKVKVNGRFVSYCCRTLKELKKNWSQEFVNTISYEKTQEFIDLGEEIRQEVILRLPVKVYADDVVAKEEEITAADKTYQPFANLKLK